MPKGHKPAPPPNKMSPQPADCRDALQWFVDSVGLYQTSTRGLIATDFSEEQEALLDQSIINLKSRGINPVVITGDALYRQGEFLWDQAVQHTRFGRPLASQFELEMTGADVLILRNLEAPETAHHLWYLYHHVFYPRVLAGKPLVMTTPLGYEEFQKYGASCDDFEFAGRKLTWQKISWLMDATCVDLQQYRTLKEEGLPPMVKAEHLLIKALKDRDMNVQAQHVLGDYMLDLAMVDRDRKLDIECDVLTSLDSTGANAWQAKKNLLLLSDGWKVLKFTVAEIESNINGCVDVVEEVWTQGRKRSSIGRLLSGQSTASVPDLPVDDDVQRLVITHNAGPCAVEGGAGTGKSSCVIHRVAYLLAQGINPDRILVLSHSQDTVKALKNSVESISDRQIAQRVSFHSWHDFGLKILKENLSAVKRKPPLKVESNPQKVIQRLLSKHKKDLDPVTLELSEELDEFTIASLISLYKANLITPKHLKERAKGDVDELVCKVFQGYEDQLQKINRIDRDDMVSLAAHALVDNADLRLKYQNQYDYVLVDEFQDATAAGDLMARILAAPQDNLYLTGDEDEAIYESKGGLPRLMADVSIRLPNARCYVLEKNWRCHPAIVDHTRQLTANLGRRRITKDMVSGWGAAPTTAIIGPQFSESEEAEAEWVADEVSILIDSGRNPQDIAVLYRYHRYGIIIEEALSRRNIRCVTSHPEAGLIPDEVGDVMAFLRLVMDPDGPKARESFERVCQLRVKEVDPKLSSTIASFAEANNLSYLKAVEIYSEAVAEQSCLDLSQLVRIIRTMHQENLPPAETISLLKRTQRLGDYYRAVKVPPGVNYEPLKKLAVLEEEARNYKTVAEFVKAQTSSPAKSSGSGFDSIDHVVHILTLHEAKGKEFAVAFLVGLAEGLFPADSAMDLEEERRLCYVGMTRAKELLYLSFPSIFNNVGLQPSSFLVEARLMAQQPMHIPAPTLPPAAPQAVNAIPAKVSTPVQPSVPTVQQQPAPVVSQPSAPLRQQAPNTVRQPQSPVQQAPAPVQQAPTPVQQAPAPVPQAPAPVQQASAPVPQAPAPVPQAPAPVQQASAPVSQALASVQQSPAPVQQAPVQQAPIPVQKSPAQQAPVQQAPVQQAPVPVQTAPVQQAPTPVQQAPVPVQQAPVKQPIFQHEPVQQPPVQQPPVQQQQPVQQQKPVQQPPVTKAPAQQAPVVPFKSEPEIDFFAPQTESVAAESATSFESSAELTAPQKEKRASASLGQAAADFHKEFQQKLLNQHAAEQKDIAIALSKEVTASSSQASVPARESTRPGRRGSKNTDTIVADDTAGGVGPVQAALQKRNKLKQESAAANDLTDDKPTPYVDTDLAKQSEVQSIPIAEQPLVTEVQTTQELDQIFAPSFDGTVRADLSIAHEQAPEQISRYKGAPPVGRRRGAPASISAPPNADAPSSAPGGNTTAPEPREPDHVPSLDAGASLANQQPMQTATPGDAKQGLLADDVPPGVVIHGRPVSKGKRGNQPPAVEYVLEDPNKPPMSYAIPDESELVASYDFSAPPDTVPGGGKPTDGIFAESQGYANASQHQPHNPGEDVAPFPASSADILTDALSVQHNGSQFGSDYAQIGEPQPFSGSQPLSPSSNDDWDLGNQPPPQRTVIPPTAEIQSHQGPPRKQSRKLIPQDEDLEDLLGPAPEVSPQPVSAAAQTIDESAAQRFEESEPAENATGYVSPSVEEYNYTAPQDPAHLQELEEEDLAHRPKCNGCGTYLEVGSQFCGECGYRLEVRIPGCHLCGSPLEPSAKFCGECGSKRSTSSPPKLMPPPDPAQAPDMESQEYEAYLAQTAQKPTQRSWVVKLLKILET